MQVEANNEVKTLLAQMFEQKKNERGEYVATNDKLREAHQTEVSDLQNKIKSVEEDLARVIAELKEQNKRSKILKEGCDDRIAAMEQREDKLRVQMMDKESEL